MTVERIYSGSSLGEVAVREAGTTRPLDPHPESSGRLRRGATSPARPNCRSRYWPMHWGDDEAAKKFQQKFLLRVITNLPERWTITRTRLLAYVNVITYDNNRAGA